MSIVSFIKMKHQFFCEVVQKNDPIIKFQMLSAISLDEAVKTLNEKYTDVKEWIIKDLITGNRYVSKF